MFHEYGAWLLLLMKENIENYEITVNLSDENISNLI